MITFPFVELFLGKIKLLLRVADLKRNEGFLYYYGFKNTKCGIIPFFLILSDCPPTIFPAEHFGNRLIPLRDLN